MQKRDLEEIPANSKIRDFNYVKDLMASKSDEDFYNKLRRKNYAGRVENIDDEIILNYLYDNDTSIYNGNMLINAINSAEGRYTTLRKTHSEKETSNWGKLDLMLKKRSKYNNG